jgi:hypothetical protein
VETIFRRICVKTNASLVSLVLGSLLLLSSCRSSEESRLAKEEKQKQDQAAIKAAIPAGSVLAKLEFGMTEGEVGAILGPPTSTDSHITGKQFIPFNFAAKDTLRTVYHYKGVGRVEFSSGSWGQRNGVVTMQADPSEPGHKR